jgi:hypothetical protein
VAAVFAGCGYGTVAEHIANVMSGLRGPWAILYWHASSRTLWFGRDMLGTRTFTHDVMFCSPGICMFLCLHRSIAPALATLQGGAACCCSSNTAAVGSFGCAQLR